MVDTNDGQDKDVEKKPQSDLPADEKTAEDKLPDEVSERTKEQFEKLKKSNQELSKKLESLEKKDPSVLDSLKPQEEVAPKGQPQPEAPNLFENILNSSKYSHLNQSQVSNIKEKLVDENGYLNADVLINSLEEANRRAAAAEQKAAKAEKRFETYEETNQMKVVHAKYPQLDPNNTDAFDKKFYNAVRNELIGQYLNGKKDVMEAANNAAEYYNLKPAKEDQKEVKAEEKKEQKAHINAGVQSGSPQYSGTEDDELVRATIKGEKGALAERLKRAGY